MRETYGVIGFNSTNQVPNAFTKNEFEVLRTSEMTENTNLSNESSSKTGITDEGQGAL